MKVHWLLLLVSGLSLTLVGFVWCRPPETPPNYVPIEARHSDMLPKMDPATAFLGMTNLLTLTNSYGGQFQSLGLNPDRQGWTGVDLTMKSAPKWNVSTWNGITQLDYSHNPNHTMWCGEILPQCSPDDPPQGYTNNYDEWLDWYGTVGNPSIPTNVTVTCVLNSDTEPGYDFLRFEVERASGWDELVDYSGQYGMVNFSQSFTVETSDYVGSGMNQVHLRFRATSDRGWSDSDCGYPSYGHSNLDNIRVTTDNGVSTYDNFEGGPVHWTAAMPQGVGDFSKVWPRLSDIDACADDNTPVFAFIDDGVVVPGTGGSPGLSWVYGPGGYVVNPNGGLAGPTAHLRNEIWSPALVWPPGPGGITTHRAILMFDVWNHLPFESGMFFVWHVRSSSDGGATWEPWRDRGLVYDGRKGEYQQVIEDVSSLLGDTRTHAQIALGVWELGWCWGLESADVTPAPYFDNVAFWVNYGWSAFSAREAELAQDAFPGGGGVDWGDLGANSVRFDMGRNIAPRGGPRNDAGDSIVVDVIARFAGQHLLYEPHMIWAMKRNPLFDPYRYSFPPTHTVRGDSVRDAAGRAIPNRFCFDLPDSNFLFPGDILHYYFEAEDGGSPMIFPDTTGFSSFPGYADYQPNRYPDAFTFRALPSLHSATPGDQPPILFWNDATDCGGDAAWYSALQQLGYKEGIDYDIFATNGPAAGEGDGLGGRATPDQISGYHTILYTCGDLERNTLSNGDPVYDPSSDIALLDGWLRLGGRKWFCTGDDLAYDLRRAGPMLTFRNTWMPMTFNNTNIRPLIQNQINPIVDPVPGNGVGLTHSYIAYGGCPVFNQFDAVQSLEDGHSTRIATFRQLSGAAYPYAAAIWFHNTGGKDNDIVYMPYDFSFIYTMTPPGKDAPAPLETRAQVLQQILMLFGHAPSGGATGVGDMPGLAFSAKSYPNPFNPSTKIAYTLTRPGQVSIKIYNVRGELVRTLLDGQVDNTAGSVTWLGDDNRGQKVASGVYFYQLRSTDGEILNKLTLVK